MADHKKDKSGRIIPLLRRVNLSIDCSACGHIIKLKTKLPEDERFGGYAKCNQCGHEYCVEIYPSYKEEGE
jgi:transcription elongation factor Elf1